MESRVVELSHEVARARAEGSPRRNSAQAMLPRFMERVRDLRQEVEGLRKEREEATRTAEAAAAARRAAEAQLKEACEQVRLKVIEQG